MADLQERLQLPLELFAVTRKDLWDPFGQTGVRIASRPVHCCFVPLYVPHFSHCHVSPTCSTSEVQFPTPHG